MSNIKGFEVSVKDYAAQRGKTVQAVYQQMKRKENAVALTGHITTRKIGNKHVKYLDEEAVAILDAGTNSTPSVIIQTETEEKLAEVTLQLEVMKQEFKKMEGQRDLLKQMLGEKEEKLLRLEGSAKEIEAQKAQNAVLSAERDEAIEKTLEAEKKAQALSDELTEARAELERLNNRGFFKRLFNK